MLILTRRAGEEINVGDDIKLVVLDITDGRVRLGIEAPQEVQIVRPDAKCKERR